MVLIFLVAALIPPVVSVEVGIEHELAPADYRGPRDRHSCLTKYRPGNASVESLPTATVTYIHWDTLSYAHGDSEHVATTTVTPPAVTSTVIEEASSVDSVYMTLTTPVPAESSHDELACGSTSTITAGSVTTIYTGTYDPPKTDALSTVVPSHFLKQRAAAVPLVKHAYGDPPSLDACKAFEVECVHHQTSYLTVPATRTLTVTISAPILTTYITSPRSGQATKTCEVPITSSEKAAGPETLNCTTTVGSAATTITQHVKCAPSNLISSVKGHGIGATQGETFGLAPGDDASACCQLCVDTKDCAASEDDLKAGNCFLWYTRNATCGIGLKYSDAGRNLAPGQGLIVQSGCGSVQPM